MKKILLNLVLGIAIIGTGFFFSMGSVEASSQQAESDVAPFYIACPGGGKHHMVGNATGRVINSKTGAILLSKGHCFRCKKCGLIIVSQNSPILGAINLGKYATGSGPVSNHTVLRTAYGLSENWKLGNDEFTKSLTWGY